MTRPTPRLEELQSVARPAAVAMDSEELGTARVTRHSFARSLIRHAVTSGWQVSVRHWQMDDQGQGRAIYRVTLGAHTVEGVVFSKVITEESRTDRVIAQDWDVTFALVDGIVTEKDMDELSRHVTKQEDGRADERTLVWARANRSQRFFDYVVDSLAKGRQPEGDRVGDAAYILRSTAFYSNGKWGLKDFDGIDSSQPLGTPYRAQMLSAWLLRDFSADLAEHCARAKSPGAASLDMQWRRYLGLGNATGLGMVPYVIRHPQVLDAWVALRELPLANARAQAWRPNSEQWKRVIALLERARAYFSEKTSLQTEPYPSGPEIALLLGSALEWAMSFRDTGQIAGQVTKLPADTLHLMAGAVSLELRQVVDSVLVEIDNSLDDDVEQLLRCEDRTTLTPSMSVSELRTVLETCYEWVDDHDFSDPRSSRMFWFYSRNNQEPRRGRRGKDRGAITEHPVGVARDVAQLSRDLGSVASDQSVGEFLLDHPQHWGIVERVQSTFNLHYTEARVNPLGEDFLPLDLQRFQLALYGMENFNPQSTDWLRVTLFGGAPTVTDVNSGVAGDDWLFSPKPDTAQ